MLRYPLYFAIFHPGACIRRGRKLRRGDGGKVDNAATGDYGQYITIAIVLAIVAAAAAV